MKSLMISADSHITEPPNTYIDNIDPAFRDRAPKMIDHEKLGDVFVIDGMSKPISLGRPPRRASRPRRSRSYGVEVRGAAPRRLGSRRPAGRPGPRRRRRRDHLPDRRHGAVQPHRPRLQAGVLRGVQPLDRRVLLSASRPAARLRADRDAHAGGRHRRPPRDQGARPARRDDARRARRRGLRLDRSTTRSGRPRSSSSCRCRSTSSRCGPRRRAGRR